MKKQLYIVSGLLCIIFVLVLVKLGVSARISTTGITLGTMQNRISELDTENMVLQQKLLTLTALTTIESKAEKMGFEQNNVDFFVNAPQHISMR